MGIQEAVKTILEEMALQRAELNVNHAWYTAETDLNNILAIHQRRMCLHRKIGEERGRDPE